MVYILLKFYSMIAPHILRWGKKQIHCIRQTTVNGEVNLH